MSDSLEQSLGISFTDKSLFRLALTHRSYLNEATHPPTDCNERLEFLGDAVLGTVIAVELYKRFPAHQEGALTSMRSNIVRGDTLARVARNLDLGQHLIMGSGEVSTGGRARASNLAAAFESIIGALFLDQGYEAAFSLCIRLLKGEIETASTSAHLQNPKSMLQELVQGRHLPAPSYRIIDTSGKAHAPTFTAEVLVDGAVLGTGIGRSKSLAEQEAASIALASLSGKA